MMSLELRCPACGRAQPVAAATAAPSVVCQRCGGEVGLALTDAVREDREVDACPVCGGRDFYVRKDLNRTLGLASVVVVGLVSSGLLWGGRTVLAYGVLAALALADLVIYQLLGSVTICYRCQTEFRGSYRRTAPPYDLHTAEDLEKEYARRLERAPGVRSRGALPR
jgi:DNA-directed RNA polymerase subunit RPC12/RpoP